MNFQPAPLFKWLANRFGTLPVAAVSVFVGYIIAAPAIVAQTPPGPPLPIPAQFESGSVSITQTDATTWQWVPFTRTFAAPPVVIMGPATKVDGSPMVVTAVEVTTTGFYLQLNEYEYLDGPHGAETVHFLALTEGTYVFGSQRWQVGTANAVNRTAVSVPLTGFTATPVVLSQVNSTNNWTDTDGALAVKTRLSGVTSTGFQVKLQTQQSNIDAIEDESVSYIAVSQGTGYLDGKILSAVLTSATVTDVFTTQTFPASRTNPIFIAQTQTINDADPGDLRMQSLTPTNVQVQFQEEISSDSNTVHTAEAVGYIVLGDMSGETLAKLEIGDVTVTQTSATTWTTVPLSHTYTTPVVVMGPLSYTNGTPLTIRVTNVTTNSFQFQVDRWDFGSQPHPYLEKLSYIVMESGSYAIGGVRWQAGRTTVPITGDNTGKNQTGVVQTLTTGFPSTPVVFSQLTTTATAQAAQSRVSAVSATGFTVEVDQSEIDTRSHANETVSWIAMTPGTSNLFSSGMRIQAGTITNQDSAFRTTTFSRMVADPFLFAALQTKVDADPATLRWRDLFADSVLLVAQEDNHTLQFGEGTVNNTHSAETSAFFVVQGAKDTDGDGAPDDWETSVGLNPLLASDGALDPDADGLTNQQEYHNRLDFVHSSDPFTFTGGTVTISTSITNGYEINDRTVASGGTNTTAARFGISRLGGRAPITVNFTVAGTPTTDTNRQPAVPGDYTLWSTTSGTGTQYTVSVPVTASSTTSYIYVRPTIYDHSPPDANAHYPRGVKMTLATGSYTIGTATNAVVVLNDAMDVPNNQRLFVGPMLPQGGAVTSASGYGTIILNGPNNAAKISTTFNGLTTPQLDVDGSHVHYSGTVIADKTIIFGEPGGLPKGPLVDYPWTILNSPSLNFSGQQAISALYRKAGAGNLYVNVHTSRYTSGEIRADLTLQTGSATFTPPPAAPALETLSTADAMRDCARFLTQATFGASDADIAALYATIPGDKTLPANRITAFTNWINAQLALTQTRLYDYNYAADQQEWSLWGAQPNLAAVVDDPLTTQNETYPAAPPPGSALDWTRWGVVPTKTGTVDDWTYRPIPTGLNKENYDPDNNNRRRAWWLAAVRGQDQLRQRVAEAMEQIFVVSDREGTITSRAYGHSRFYDMLGDFVGGVRHLQPPNGSYCTINNSTIRVKELLKDVSMSPIMGQYLSHLKNQKQTTDASGNVITSPDENYAREVMQLFSIGLLKLWEDGTLQLGADGQPIATYSNDDIKGLAKVFTGWSFSCVQNSAKNGYVPPVLLSNTDSTKQSANFLSSAGAEYFHPGFENPMQNYPNYHDEGTKAFLGTTLPAYGGVATDYTSRVAYANTEMDSTADWLFNHANIAPFLSYRLIQRLVTSNPSRGYVYRVAKTFEDSAYPGTGGIRGSLPAVLKAILLDYEARSLTNVDPQTVNTNTSVNVSFGKVKEPMIRYIQVLRAFGAKSQLPVSALNSFGYTQISNLGTNPTRFRYASTVADLAQTPNDMPSVFNWYLPDYSPGGQVSAAGLVAPELQIITENIAVRSINYHRTIDYSSVIDSTSPTLPGGQGTSNILGDTTTGTVLDNVFIDLSGLTTDYMTNRNATGATETTAATYLVDRLDALLCSGSLKAKYPYTAGSTDPRSIMIDQLATISVHAVPVPNANAGARVRAALYLITSTPEFIVQK